MAYLLASLIFSLCFLGIGIGIIIFGRKDISGECGKVPNHQTNECPSKKAGVCPTQRKDDALDMALAFSQFHKIKKRQPFKDEA